MSRPKKPEERNRIMTIAFNTISREGFDKATIAEIARRSGVTKSLVQYYFPKKDQFMSEFINLSLSTVSDLVYSNPELKTDNPFEHMYAMGAVQYYMIIRNPLVKDRKLINDFLFDRNLTLQLFNYFIEWCEKNTDFIANTSPEERQYDIDILSFTFGGAFEYIFKCISEDRDIDVKVISDLGLHMVRKCEVPLHRTFGSINMLDKITLEWIDECVPKYNDIMFGRSA